MERIRKFSQTKQCGHRSVITGIYPRIGSNSWETRLMINNKPYVISSAWRVDQAGFATNEWLDEFGSAAIEQETGKSIEIYKLPKVLEDYNIVDRVKIRVNQTNTMIAKSNENVIEWQVAKMPYEELYKKWDLKYTEMPDEIHDEILTMATSGLMQFRMIKEVTPKYKECMMMPTSDGVKYAVILRSPTKMEWTLNNISKDKQQEKNESKGKDTNPNQ